MIFYWNDDAINYLNVRKPIGCHTLSDKKHRLVCYFFESTMQCCLSPLDNVSANPGCECFTLIRDGGFDTNVKIGDVPELDLPTCDLLHVVLSTD